MSLDPESERRIAEPASADADREARLTPAEAVEHMRRVVEQEGARSRASPEVRKRLEGLRSHDRLGPQIESFWLEPENRRARTWTEHLDINEVMLATSLVPEGCLALASLD